MKLGTAWTDRNVGATLNDLHDAIGVLVRWRPTNDAEHAALKRLVYFSQITPGAWCYRTNLQLTGEPLQPYDLERIASSELR